MNAPHARPQSPLAIEVAGLTKRFDRTTALRDVDLQLKAGEALALFGHNGAGKSTLLRTLSTLVRPDSGTIRVGGHDRAAHASAIRAIVGYVGHQSLLYDDMTPRENLRFYAKLYGVPDASERIERSLAEVGATSYANRRARTLSNGMQKRVAIARSLLHRPSVLLLDEPETGLDEAGLKLLDDVVIGVKRGGASVVMSTHSIERGLRLSDQVLVLADGRVVMRCAATETSVDAVQNAVLSSSREAA